jgi:hypothetical protein
VTRGEAPGLAVASPVRLCGRQGSEILRLGLHQVGVREEVELLRDPHSRLLGSAGIGRKVEI